MANDTNFDYSDMPILQKEETNVIVDWSDIYFELTENRDGTPGTLVLKYISGDTNLDFSDMPILQREEPNVLVDWSDIYFKLTENKDGAPNTSVSVDYFDMSTRQKKETNASEDWFDNHFLKFERRPMDTAYSNNRTQNRTSFEPLGLVEEFGQWFSNGPIEPTLGFFGVTGENGLFFEDTPIEPNFRMAGVTGEDGITHGTIKNQPTVERSKDAVRNGMFSKKTTMDLKIDHTSPKLAEMEPIIEQSEVAEKNDMALTNKPFESILQQFKVVGEEVMFSEIMPIEQINEESGVIEINGEYYFDPEEIDYEPFVVREDTEQSEKQKNAVDLILEQINENTGTGNEDNSTADGRLYYDPVMAKYCEPFGVREETKQSQEQNNDIDSTLKHADSKEETGMGGGNVLLGSSVVKEQNGCSYCVCQRCGFENPLPAQENGNLRLSFGEGESHITAERINEILSQPVPAEIDVWQLFREISTYLIANDILHKTFAERILNVAHSGWMYYLQKTGDWKESKRNGRVLVGRMYNFNILDSRMKRAALDAQLFEGKEMYLRKAKKRQKKDQKSLEES